MCLNPWRTPTIARLPCHRLHRAAPREAQSGCTADVQPGVPTLSHSGSLTYKRKHKALLPLQETRNIRTTIPNFLSSLYMPSCKALLLAKPVMEMSVLLMVQSVSLVRGPSYQSLLFTRHRNCTNGSWQVSVLLNGSRRAVNQDKARE